MPEATRKTDIAIVGGGFAGLALALALVRTVGEQLSIEVLDARPPSPGKAPRDSRASALSAGSLHLLRAIDIWPRIERRAQPITAIDLSDGTLQSTFRPILLSYSNLLDGGEHASQMVENADLLSALEDAATAEPSLRVTRGAEVADVRMHEDGTKLETAAGESIHARLVVAADGARSRIRSLAGIKIVRIPYGQRGIVVTVRAEKPHDGRARQHFLPGGPFAMLPLRDNRISLVWSEDAKVAESILAAGERNFRAELMRRFGHHLGTIEVLDQPRSWPLELRLARSLVAARTVLVGDAARTVHPIAGQGLNLALRDVAALAEVLAEHHGLGLDPFATDNLERYERWRRFDGVASAMTYDAINRLFSNDNTLLRSLRDAGFGLVDRMPGLKKFLVREAAGMTGTVPRLLKGEPL